MAGKQLLSNNYQSYDHPDELLINKLNSMIEDAKSELFYAVVVFNQNGSFYIDAKPSHNFYRFEREELYVSVDTMQLATIKTVNRLLQDETLIEESVTSNIGADNQKIDYLSKLLSLVSENLNCFRHLQDYQSDLSNAMNNHGLSFGDIDHYEYYIDFLDEINDAILPKTMIDVVEKYVDDDIGKLEKKVATIAKALNFYA